MAGRSFPEMVLGSGRIGRTETRMTFRVASQSLQITETYDTKLQAEERKRELDSVCRGRGLPTDVRVELISPAPTLAVAERGKDSPKWPPRSAGVRIPGQKKNRKRNTKRARK